MIDFVKLQPCDNVSFEKHIVSSKTVDLKLILDTFTGEIKEYPKVGKLLNLEIRINPVYSSITGSLHKFENMKFSKEEQNYNDFTYSQLSSLIPELLETFDLDGKTSLSYLELGFNLKVDFDIKHFIDNHLLMYDFRSHNKNLKYNGRGDYKEFIKTDYNLKIYSKSKQFRLKENILRIELKITKKRFLQKLGIYALEDLLVKENLYNLYKVLYNEFEKVIIIDDFSSIEICQKDIDKLNKYTNPHYWQRLKETTSYKKQNGLKKDFGLICCKNGLNVTKKDLKEKLDSKFLELINSDDQDFFYLKKIV